MSYKSENDITELTKALEVAGDSPYRVMRDAAAKKEVWDFQEKTKDGTVTEFTAQFAVKRTGGGVNGVIECEVTMAVQSEIKQTDPA